MDIRITHIISLDASLMGLLVSAANGAVAAGGAGMAPKPTTEIPAGGATGDGPQATALKDAGFEAAGAAAADAGNVDDGAVDAAGWPWDASLHAATKGQTKDGLWRMKVGVNRPDPKPGFPKTANLPGFPKETGGTGTTNNGAASPAPDTAASAGAGPATEAEDEDEFAAFRAAANKAGAGDAAAAASVPARKWTDADLGALCNQAAVKFGDPAPVKAIIQEYVPADAVPHSRNIPDDKREAFAQAVEAKADIKFAG